MNLPATRCADSRRRPRSLATFVLPWILLVGLATVTGCSPADAPDVSEVTTETVGSGMAGPVVDVNVSEEALASEPGAPDLSSPEAAVRSYLDWISYAYRIGQSQVALPTMSSYQEVHVDSYVQYNIQKGRLLDQKLISVTFGVPVSDGEKTLLPVDETWSYTYVSIKNAGEVIAGPYEASYEATYTVVRSETGDWVVDAVEAKALGEVK